MNNIAGQEIIKFYRASGKFGFLSNLFKTPITFEGKEFPTSEHAYQSGKFANEETREWVMKAHAPHLVAIVAHGLFKWDVVKSWSKMRFERMEKILFIKFSDPELKKKLLNTNNAILIENSTMDNIWGTGPKGTGKNMLGKLLMKVRKEIQEQENLKDIDPAVKDHYDERIKKLLQLEDGWDTEFDKRINPKTIDNSLVFYSLFRKHFKEKYDKELPFLMMMPGCNDEIDLEDGTNDFRILISIPSNIEEYAGVYAINYITNAEVKKDFLYYMIPEELIDWMYEVYVKEKEE